MEWGELAAREAYGDPHLRKSSQVYTGERMGKAQRFHKYDFVSAAHFLSQKENKT